MTVTEYIAIAFPALFVILNPFMAASSFMSMTLNLPRTTRVRIAKKACLTSFMILLVFAAAGHLIFQLFQITVEAFRIAGGIILFTVGLDMLNLQPLRIKQTEEEKKEFLKKEGDAIGVVPLGVPILSGPGAITTVIVLMGEIKWVSKTNGLLQVAGLLFSAALSLAIIYYIMIHSHRVLEKFKVTGIGVMTRIMGLILSVIAVQFIINGLKDLLPKFAHLVS